MTGSSTAPVTRRRFLQVGGLLAAMAAGCTAPATTPESDDGGARSVATEVSHRAREVGEQSRPAVVVLQPAGAITSGTAWFLDGGHLLTNNHVVEELGAEIMGHTIDGTTFEVDVDRRRDTPDLALLSTSIDPPATLSTGDSTALEPDQPLVQIGHPRVGYWTIALGRFKRRVRRADRTWVLTEMPMMLGNSGSPLLTLDGAVVGLTFGSVPKPGTGPSENPTPRPPTVYESYPRQTLEYGGHIAIESVERAIEEWTDVG